MYKWVSGKEDKYRLFSTKQKHDVLNKGESATLLTLGGITTACWEDECSEQISFPNLVCLIAIGNGLLLTNIHLR